MSKKRTKVCRVLRYIDHSFIVTLILTECVSISPSAF